MRPCRYHGGQAESARWSRDVTPLHRHSHRDLARTPPTGRRFTNIDECIVSPG